MTRGRKKDLTIPPSRALAQQRDYRARKARYIADLEQRCKKVEEENDRLRKELDLVRGGLPGPSTLFSSETAKASSELMQQLGAASTALAHFQQLAFTDISRPAQSFAPQATANTSLRPAHFPSPQAPISLPPISSPPRFHSNYRRHFSDAFPKPSDLSRGHNYDMDNELPPLRFPSRGSSANHSRDRSRSESEDSECCGGIVDCDALIDDEDEQRRHRRTISSSSMADTPYQYRNDPSEN